MTMIYVKVIIEAINIYVFNIAKFFFLSSTQFRLFSSSSSSSPSSSSAGKSLSEPSIYLLPFASPFGLGYKLFRLHSSLFLVFLTISPSSWSMFQRCLRNTRVYPMGLPVLPVFLFLSTTVVRSFKQHSSNSSKNFILQISFSRRAHILPSIKVGIAMTLCNFNCVGFSVLFFSNLLVVPQV